jgi:hypothetical protein
MLTKSRISLFCSFTALLRLVSQNEVSSEELSDGLFAFACTRYHVFDDPETEVSLFTEDKNEQERLLHKIRTAVLKAEDDNRVVWRTREEGKMSYKKISELLNSQGLKPLASFNSDYYSYNGLRLKMEGTNPGVLVRF